MHQCFWLGVDRTRWARVVYGAGLGREYKVSYPPAQSEQLAHHDDSLHPPPHTLGPVDWERLLPMVLLHRKLKEEKQCLMLF